MREKLAHKQLETTLIYWHLIDFRDEEFTVRAAETVEQATKLIESGFEYVTEMGGVRVIPKEKIATIIFFFVIQTIEDENNG